MVAQGSVHKKHKLHNKGDGGAKSRSRVASRAVTKNAENATIGPKKRRSADDAVGGTAADEGQTMDVDGEEEDEEVEEEEEEELVGEGDDPEDRGADDDAEAEPEECVRGPDGKCVKRRHIHPCICDLTKKQRQKISEHWRMKRTMQRKFDRRVKEIEAELARMEEERLEREREMQEQEELFGDEYEVVGKKRKRKKRSARRASMVSLGVKQVINWRKDPRIEVKATMASSLRKKYTVYCGRVVYPLSPVRPIDFHKEPELPIRTTVTSNVRSKVNIAKKDWLIKHEDKRKLFETPYYV